MCIRCTSTTNILEIYFKRCVVHHHFLKLYRVSAPPILNAVGRPCVLVIVLWTLNSLRKFNIFTCMQLHLPNIWWAFSNLLKPWHHACQAETLRDVLVQYGTCYYFGRKVNSVTKMMNRPIGNVILWILRSQIFF